MEKMKPQEKALQTRSRDTTTNCLNLTKQDIETQSEMITQSQANTIIPDQENVDEAFDTQQEHHILEFTTDEIQKAIKTLKKGKAADAKGVNAEMLMNCDEETNELTRDTFNMFIKQNIQTPSTWKQATTKVIHKKGESTQPTNYRPSARYRRCMSCSALCHTRGFTTSLTSFKFLSRLVSETTTKKTDHLHLYKQIAQKCRE